MSHDRRSSRSPCRNGAWPWRRACSRAGLVEEGAEIAAGEEIMDIETTKIANVFESPVAGVLRRKVVGEGETVPVGALLGVVADAGVRRRGRRLRRRVPGGVQAARRRPATPRPSRETIEAGGRRIRYLAAGRRTTGTPIVLIHGFGADLTSWMFNQAALAEDRPAYALDLPGHGGSAKDVGDGSTSRRWPRRCSTSWTRTASPRRISSAIRSAARSRSICALDHADAGRVADPDRPAGLGPEINMAFIEGFIGRAGARAAAGARDAGRRPGAGHARHGRGRAEVQAARRREAALRPIADANFAGGRQALVLRDRLAGSTCRCR